MLKGAVFNVALNLTSGEVTTTELHPGTAMYIPKSYAHEYMTLEEEVIFQWAVDKDLKAAARVERFDSCEIK